MKGWFFKYVTHKIIKTESYSCFFFFLARVSYRVFMLSRKSSSYSSCHPKTPVVARVNANRYEVFLITHQDTFPEFFPPELIKQEKISK